MNGISKYNGITEHCHDGYWDSGADGARCRYDGKPEEDKAHWVQIWVRRVGECLEAHLWSGAGAPPSEGAGEWKRWAAFPIRVQTYWVDVEENGEMKTEPVTRVFVPSVPNELLSHPKLCPGSEDEMTAQVRGKS